MLDLGYIVSENIFFLIISRAKIPKKRIFTGTAILFFRDKKSHGRQPLIYQGMCHKVNFDITNRF